MIRSYEIHVKQYLKNYRNQTQENIPEQVAIYLDYERSLSFPSVGREYTYAKQKKND